MKRGRGTCSANLPNLADEGFRSLYRKDFKTIFKRLFILMSEIDYKNVQLKIRICLEKIKMNKMRLNYL